MTIALGLLIGVVVGIISGIVGIGGGVLVVPILVYGFKYSQKMAQGTSLAMLLPPIGIGAVLQYYRAGEMDIKMAILLAVGFVAGGYFGGGWAQHLSNLVLRRTFAVVLAAMAVKMFFQK
jgi:uncharacterized protein